MTENKKNLQRISTLRKVLTVTLLMTFTFGGIFSGGISIGKFENYFHPYSFGLLFATIGLLVGVITAKKLKPYFAVTKKLRSDYGGGIFIVSVGFIGTFMLLGHYINQSLSTIEKCNDYTIIDKYYQQGGRNKPPQIDLYINLDGKTEKVKCNLPYYNKVEIGDKINICKYSSLIGFDFYKLTYQQEILF